MVPFRADAHRLGSADYFFWNNKDNRGYAGAGRGAPRRQADLVDPGTDGAWHRIRDETEHHIDDALRVGCSTRGGEPIRDLHWPGRKLASGLASMACIFTICGARRLETLETCDEPGYRKWLE